MRTATAQSSSESKVPTRVSDAPAPSPTTKLHTSGVKGGGEDGGGGEGDGGGGEGDGGGGEGGGGGGGGVHGRKAKPLFTADKAADGQPTGPPYT